MSDGGRQRGAEMTTDSGIIKLISDIVRSGETIVSFSSSNTKLDFFETRIYRNGKVATFVIPRWILFDRISGNPEEHIKDVLIELCRQYDEEVKKDVHQ